MVGCFSLVKFPKAEPLCKAIFSRSVNTIVGGGDTVYAIKIAKIKEIPENIHISTGGGATLELMSGKPMPGINCLIGKPF